MATALLVIQVFIVFSLIVSVLLQQNAGDSLAGLSGGGNSVFSSRTTSNFLSKFTATLGILLLLNSLLIARFYSVKHEQPASLSDSIVKEQQINKPIVPEAE